MKNKTSFHKFMESKVINVELGAIDELKSLQSVINSNSNKASSQLDSAINALKIALKSANEAVSKARRAQAMAKELGVDEKQFDGWEKQFVQNRDAFDSAISAIGKIQNNI